MPPPGVGKCSTPFNTFAFVGVCSLLERLPKRRYCALLLTDVDRHTATVGLRGGRGGGGGGGGACCCCWRDGRAGGGRRCGAVACCGWCVVCSCLSSGTAGSVLLFCREVFPLSASISTVFSTSPVDNCAPCGRVRTSCVWGGGKHMLLLSRLYSTPGPNIPH